jgi:hypothetical protein
MTRIKVLVLGAAMIVGTAGVAFAQRTTPVTKREARDLRRDHRDIVRDTHEARTDARDLRADKRDVRQDLKAGDRREA